MSHARTVIEEQCVSEELENICSHFTRAEDLYYGLTWRLARAPALHAEEIPGTALYVIKTDQGVYRQGDVPTIRLLYSFDDDHVYVKDIALIIEKIAVGQN